MAELELGVYGRVLYCGQLEKRRDGAVRAGWATRLFLLTPEALHYFRKATDFELLGEERGYLPLSAITSVRAMPEDEAPYASVELGSEHYYLEIATESRAFLMRAPVSEASTCESWSIAIEEQRKALRAKQTDQRECSSAYASSSATGRGTSLAEVMPSPTLLARNHELFSLFEASPPRVAMVSVVRVNERDARPVEIVVKRRVAWNELVPLGVVPQGGACVILLQGGGIARIGTQALMGSWDAGRPCWIEATDTEAPTEIEVSVACKVLPSAASTSPTVSKVASTTSARDSLPRWLDWADEGSSVGFLLMCLFVHLLYGVEGFHWAHKCCLTVGAALAISTILNGSASRGTSSGSSGTAAPVSSPTPKHHTNPTTLLPTLQFTLTVHRCRIKMEGTEFVYPTASPGKTTGASGFK